MDGGGMRENILKKILDFIQSLPEGEGLEGEPQSHETGESEGVETGEHPKGSLEIMSVQAGPKDAADLKNKMKGC